MDSLAPSVTTILCERKQLSLGVFGQEETAITSPLPPTEISEILYSKVFNVSPREAVLQQEIVLTLGSRILVIQPQLLTGVLFIRIGWIIEAMRIELAHSNRTDDIFSLSPSEIKALLEEVLTLPFNDVFHWRQIQGALNKVPSDFYRHVWLLLERSVGGIKIAGKILPANPTLSDMDATDGGFQLIVEDYLKNIQNPEQRFMAVDTFVIIATVLQRNPELSFTSHADIDQIIEVVFNCFTFELRFSFCFRTRLRIIRMRKTALKRSIDYPHLLL